MRYSASEKLEIIRNGGTFPGTDTARGRATFFWPVMGHGAKDCLRKRPSNNRSADVGLLF